MIFKFILVLISFATSQAYENEFMRYETDSRLEISREWSFNENVTIHYSKKISKGDTFIFAICNDNLFPSEITCDVITQHLGNDNHLQPNETCNMEFVPGDGNKFMGIEFDLDHLTLDYLEGPRKPVITWNEIDTENHQLVYKYISIINMSLCKTSTLKFQISLNDAALQVDRTFELLVYEDTFDVIVTGSAECPGSGWCRISYDKMGQKIGDASAFPLNLLYLNLTMTQPLPKSKEVFAYGVSHFDNGSTIVAYHIMLDGVIELETSITSGNSTLTPLVSTANNMFLICGKYPEQDWESPLHCNQYVNGSSEPTFDFEDTTLNQAISVHNLPDGKVFIFGHDQYDRASFVYTVIEQKEDSFERRTRSFESNFISKQADDFTFVIQNENVSADDNTDQLCVYYAYSYLYTGKIGDLLVHNKLCLRGEL